MHARLLIVVLLTLCSWVKPPEEDSIPWSGVHRLSWADFKAKPDPLSTNAALTSSKISFVYQSGGSNFKYKITCHFNRKASWGKVKTDLILAHEQGHFDISEIHARRLHRALQQYKINQQSLTKDVSGIYQSIMEAQNNVQNEYDTETNFSRNREKQLQWQQKIQKELDNLVDYSNYASSR